MMKSSHEEDHAALVFCVVTSQRKDNTSYLPRTLLSIVDQWDDGSDKTTVHPHFGLAIKVLNVDGHDIAIPDQIQKRMVGVHGIRNRTIEHCLQDERDDEDTKIPNLVPCKVRQQTWDVAAALEECAGTVAAASTAWIILVEDDTELCSGSLKTIQEALLPLCQTSSSEYHCPKAYKFAKSFSGTAFPKAGLRAYTAHARSKIRSFPVDLSVHHAEWNGISTDNQVTMHGSNLFHHIGEVSTFEYRNLPNFKQNYDEMRTDQCFMQLL